MVDSSVVLLRSSMNSNNYTCIKDGAVATSSFAFVLSFFYLVLGAVCCFQLVRLIFNKHRVLHYQGFFFIMCLAWCVLRWVQFLFLNANLTTYSVYWLFLFLDTFPLNVQFACFSLLVIYFAEIVHKKTWRRYMETRFKWAYLIANCFFLVWTLAFIIAELATSDSGSSDPSSSNTTADNPCPAGETAQAPPAADITTTL
ncbi:MAG: DUF1084 domain-containing protein, partial [archaeon]|nr:DUF1084 domain-containing protein [archaeon]